VSADFPKRAAWLEYRGRPKGPFMRWAQRNRTRRRGEHDVEQPFDRSRNAEKGALPVKRKHRVRLKAALEGRLIGRPLTAHERRWL